MSLPNPPHTGSVTGWIADLGNGNADEALRQIWLRYFSELVGFARRRLGDASRVVRDEEDAALSALDSFFHRFREGRYPELLNRDALWPLLITMTARKAADHRRWSQAQRRGGAGRAQDLRSDAPNVDEITASGPSPEFALEVAEETERLLALLPREELRETALWKLQGYTNGEIAEKHGVIERTVERRVALIRNLWSMGEQDRGADLGSAGLGDSAG
jgi:DNA-directed RNA polymerase specialized sigma24 family protein